MSLHPLTWLFAVTLLAALGGRLWLATRQVRHVAVHRDAVPGAFAARVSLQAHQRAADYTVAKTRFGLLTTALDSALLLGWTLLGGLDALNVWMRDAVLPHWGALPYQLALLSAFMLVSAVLDLPFEWWRTFRIEQHFGFNRSTGWLFVSDLLKSMLVAALLEALRGHCALEHLH